MKRAALCLFLLVIAPVCHAAPQGSGGSDPRIAEARRLAAEKQWEELVVLTATDGDPHADLDFYRGLALARLERWPEADAAFRTGAERSPGDARFPRELAGVAFRRGNYTAAKSHLRAVLRLEPGSEYALNFLATVYFLDGNLEAALQLWNRMDKPVLADVTLDPQPRLQPDLLQRALVFPPVGTLWLADLRAAEARIENLGVFPYHRFELQAEPGEEFTLTFREVERNGLGAGRWDAALSMLRGLPFQTVHLDLYNLNHAAMNWLSLLRWDAQKRRAFTSFSSPLRGDPKWRWAAHADARNENWDLRGTLATGVSSAVNLQRVELGLALGAVESGRWQWRSSVTTAYRNFRRPSGIPPSAAPFFTDGISLRYDATVQALVWGAPQRRFRIDATGGASAGRYFARPLGGFAGVWGSLTANWLPQARGDDYETQAGFRFGRTFGDVSLDELFVLGVERDNALLLRGHAGTHNGRKGSAPLGRQYALFNLEADKILYRGLISVKLGPFLDAGRTSDASGFFGSGGWLCDAGVQLKIGIGGSMQVVLSYGRDLRDGGGVFFARTVR